MQKHRAFSCVCLVAVLLAGGLRGDASGRDSLQVAPGCRVAIRVTPNLDVGYGERQWWMGTLEHLTADSLYFRLEKEYRVRGWPRESIRHLRVSTGIRGHTGGGVILGCLVGIPVGIGIASGQKEAPGYMEISSEQLAGFFGTWVVCMIAGGIIGNNIRSERWEDVDLTVLPSMPDSSRAARHNE